MSRQTQGRLWDALGFSQHNPDVFFCLFAGRSASDTVVQQAARLSQTYFLKHCAWPLPQLTAGVQVAYRVWRRPLYAAGRYLKLLRGVAQVCCSHSQCMTPHHLCMVSATPSSYALLHAGALQAQGAAKPARRRARCACHVVLLEGS